MTSTPIHRTSRRQRLACMTMFATSVLLMITTLMGFLNLSPTHAAQAHARVASNTTPLMDGKVSIYSTTTQTNTRFTLTNKSDQPITSLTLYEFYSRPTGFMPNTNNSACSTPMLSFTPSLQVKDATQACPWFTCNYLSWNTQGSNECDIQGLSASDLNAHKNAQAAPVFESVPPTADQLDTYMALPLNFGSTPLAPGASLGLDSCIYYDNWPHTNPQQKNVLLVYSGDTLGTASGTASRTTSVNIASQKSVNTSEHTLLWGTPPMDMSTILSKNAISQVPVTTGGWGQ
jgi:hypothetical protein